MKVKLEDLDRLLMRIRLTLIAIALFFLFVVPIPPLAVIIASIALLMRVMVLSAAARQWLVRQLVIPSDQPQQHDRSDSSND